MDEALEQQIDSLLDAQNYNAALTAIEDGYGPEILGYMIARARRRVDAEDAFGNFREAIVKGIRSFRRLCSVRNWLYVVARNELSSFLKSGVPQAVTLQSDAAAAPTPPSTWLKSQAGRDLSTLRGFLDDDEQEILILRIDRELPFADIAQILSVPPDAMVSEESARQRFQRAKAKLAELYEQGAHLRT